MSCIERKAIPQSILPRLLLEERIELAIGRLTGYNFVTKRGDDKISDMYGLVQLATQLWAKKEGD
jgi:hypothetical protein